MKELFKKLWNFIKRLFHIGHEVIEENLEETKEELIARLKEELAQLDKEIAIATGETLEYLQVRA